MTPDADQCCKLAQEAAAAAIRHGGVSIEIRLLCANGYHLYTWTGQPPAALVELAALPVQGGEQ